VEAGGFVLVASTYLNSFSAPLLQILLSSPLSDLWDKKGPEKQIVTEKVGQCSPTKTIRANSHNILLHTSVTTRSNRYKVVNSVWSNGQEEQAQQSHNEAAGKR
jgi:hypothetical protein